MCAKEFGIPPWVADEMPIYYEWALVDGYNEFYRDEDEPHQGYEGDDPYDYLPEAPAPSQEGYSVRKFEGKLSDGTAKHYYPSASKGDVMATGEQLQVLFGVNYVDEREESN